MMKRTRAVLAVLCLLVLAAGLVGCEYAVVGLGVGVGVSGYGYEGYDYGYGGGGYADEYYYSYKDGDPAYENTW